MVGGIGSGMPDEKPRFTSDRRFPTNSSWSGSGDWEAGSPVGLDIADQALVARTMVESFDFSTFDPSVWTTHNDASYNASNEYVTMVSGGGENGELEYNAGTPQNPWFCEWDNIHHRGNYEFQQFLFYADAVGAGGDGQDTTGISQACRIQVNYNGYVTLDEIVDGVSTRLELASTSTITHTYRVEYNDGTVRFYVDGAEKVNHTFSSPNTQYSKLYFKSVTGRNSSVNSIDNVSIGSL